MLCDLSLIYAMEMEDLLWPKRGKMRDGGDVAGEEERIRISYAKVCKILF